MFRRKPKIIGEIINLFLRNEGLELPLIRRRLIESWDEITGNTIAKYTQEKFIKNQTLFVKITNPALRADLTMMKATLIQKLNAQVGSFVISDIKFY